MKRHKKTAAGMNPFKERDANDLTDKPGDCAFKLSWATALAGLIVLLLIPAGLYLVDASESGWDALSTMLAVIMIGTGVSLILFIISLVFGLKIVRNRRVALWWLIPIGLLLLGLLLYLVIGGLFYSARG